MINVYGCSAVCRKSCRNPACSRSIDFRSKLYSFIAHRLLVITVLFRTCSYIILRVRYAICSLYPLMHILFYVATVLDPTILYNKQSRYFMTSDPSDGRQTSRLKLQRERKTAPRNPGRHSRSRSRLNFEKKVLHVCIAKF